MAEGLYTFEEAVVSGTTGYPCFACIDVFCPFYELPACEEGTWRPFDDGE
jgi:hypothetical protein